MWPQLVAYAPTSASWFRTLVGPQALTSEPVHPIIRAVRKQKQAEVLVALENLKHKEQLSAAVALGLGIDPAFYREAMRRPDAERWREATGAEIASLLKNKTWKLVKLPPGKRALAC
ncbi:hypothetical protein PI124_g12282 [Phytophthora idaei]|nr:hypothetical protein PI126_g15551 [Phytophthora idaei]KAG3242895.1 hypothetical protein PI124_g12282 [Phytophthora idaei]